MLCPRCYGKHVVVMNGARVPCPECAGIGEIHCCDGLREQECPVREIVAPPDPPDGAERSRRSGLRLPAAT